MRTEPLPNDGQSPATLERPGDDEPGPMRTVPIGPGGTPAGGVHTPDAHAADPDRAEELVGRILSGRYEVRGVLGRGGMGIVYEGRHITVGRRVAIKVLRRDLARSTQAVARFQREAQAAALIGNPHIVEVLDYGYADEGQAFLVMERLEGEDLGRLIRRDGALDEARAVAIARQVAKALAAAHAKGIIHRDLKSENVFVVERDGAEFVKLLDFGISKISEGDDAQGPMTSEGVVMGTPHYMAPEQAVSALEADHRIDLYALGCLLYEMLTGRVPFTGKNPVEVVFKHVHEPPVPPSKARADGRVSPETEAVALKLLAKDRDQRFQTAADVVAALPASGSRLSMVDARESSLPTTSEVRPREVTRPPPAPPPSRWRLLAGTVVVVAGGAALSALLVTHHHPPMPNRPSRSVAATDGGLALRSVSPDAGAPVLVVADAGARANGRVVVRRVVPGNAEVALFTFARNQRVGQGIGRLDATVDVGRMYRVVVSAPGYLSEVRQVVPEAGHETVELDHVELRPARAVAVHVESDAGAGAAAVPTDTQAQDHDAGGAGENNIDDLHPSNYGTR